MQVSPFKAVLKSLVPNVDVLATWPRGDASRVPARLLRLWSPLLTMITSLLTWSHPLAHRVSVRFSSLNDGITHATVVMIVGWRASVCGYAEVCAPSLIGSGAHPLFDASSLPLVTMSLLDIIFSSRNRCWRSLICWVIGCKDDVYLLSTQFVLRVTTVHLLPLGAVLTQLHSSHRLHLL